MTARRQRRLEELHCCGMAARTPKRSGRAVRQLVALKSVAEAGGSQLQGVIGVGRIARRTMNPSISRRSNAVAHHCFRTWRIKPAKE